MRLTKYYLFTAFFILSLTSCDDKIQSSIPDYPIYLQLNLTSTYPTFKNSNNNFLLFKSIKNLPIGCYIGYGGVVVCTGTSLDDSGNTQYYAFDMACPYEVKNTTLVYPDSTGLARLVCEKCGTVYDVSFGNGNPISGPSKEFLKRYKASLSGDVLYITR